MQKTSIFLSAALLALLAGCSPTAAKTDDTKKEGEAKDGLTKPEEKAPADLSADLKHEAYEFMGLDRTEEYTYTISRLKGQAGEEGTQAVSQLEAKDDTAKFQITRSGALVDLGTEDVEVRKDGIYQLRMSMGELKEPMLLMPGDIKPGSTWNSKFDLNNVNGQKVSFEVTNKAERIEKIKVKAGEFDGLLVTTSGSMTVDGTKNQMSSKTWYGKGIGTLKMTIEVKKPTGEPSVSTVELVKEGKKS